MTDPSVPAPSFVALDDELFAVLDLQGRILAVTPWWAHVLHRAEAEMVGVSVLDLLPEDERQGAANAVDLAASRGQTRGGDVRMLDADGTAHPMRIHLFRSPLSDEIYAVGQDLEKVTAIEAALEFRLAVERAIAQISSRMIATPAEDLPAAIREGLGALAAALDVDRAYLLAFDEQGQAIEIAEEWCAPGVTSVVEDLASVPRDLPQSAARLIEAHGIKSSVMVPVVVEGIPRGAVGVTTVEHPIELEDDVIGLLQMVGEVWINRIQRARAERGLAETKAELELRNADLERSNHELQEFAYVASHDLKSPLLVVRGFLDLLVRQKRDVLDEDARTYIDAAARGSERMERLIEDLLAYSRAGRREAAARAVDVTALLNAVVADSSAEIAAAGATVKVGELPTIQGDETLLRQVFQNLLGNAIKFARPGVDPVVKVDAAPLATEWVIRVSDNGFGVAPADRQRIFTMFTRIDPTGDRPGSGIGLAICARAVAAHRGRIWVEPAPGGGSRFCVALPA